MKKVIWITSFFPPFINVAAARNAKLLKYLPDNGWEALVVCPEYQLAQTPASRSLLEPLSDAIRLNPSGPDRFIDLVSRRDRKRIARYLTIVMNNAVPPDGHFFWALTSLKFLGETIRRFRPDIIYTTCNPYSLNLLGAWARRKYRIPWVTDFRDLWTLNQQPRRALNRYHQTVSGYLEKKYLRQCDFFIASTNNSKQRMVAKYPGLAAKSDVVPNGFDPQDIPAEPTDGIQTGSFLYSGSIVKNTAYHPLRVLKLLNTLADNGHLRPDWQIHYAGGQGDAFKNYVSRAGIKARCIDHGYLDHHHYYRLIQRMAYIVMALPHGMDCGSWIPSRFYDYIGNKANIICMAPRGSEIFTLLEEYKQGVALVYEDPEAVTREKLIRYLAQSHKIQPAPDSFIAAYSRKRQACKLAEIFNTVLKKHLQVTP